MYESMNIVITVMAYPVITTKHGEAVCIAGLRIDEMWDPKWVRLFPVDVRDLPKDLRLSKWDELRLKAHKATNDHRPESYTPDNDSIVIAGKLSTRRSWESRQAIMGLVPLVETMRQVESRQERDRSSLALVATGEVLDLVATPRPAKEIAEAAAKALRLSAQLNLFAGDERQPLEPVPYDFHYLIRYPDEVEPRRLKLVDWEINQTWRKWRYQYQDAVERIRDKWLNELTGPTREPSFIVGNQRRFPDQFLLLNVYSPPRSEPGHDHLW